MRPSTSPAAEPPTEAGILALALHSEADTGSISAVPEIEELTAQQLLESLIAGSMRPSDLTLEQERNLRRYCRERAKVSARKIQELVDRGHFKHARRARTEHLNSAAVQLHSLFYGARKRWRASQDASVEQREALRKKRLTEIFQKLRAIARFNQPARAEQFFIDKANCWTSDEGPRRWRPITSFYWVDRARQHLLKSALAPFANLHDGQFMLSRDPARRGPAAVRKALLAALGECDEDSVFIQLDVVDYYGSISLAWLERNLGVDPSIVRKHLHMAGIRLNSARPLHTVHGRQTRQAHEAERERGRRGIPQGSVISSLIAEQVMASVLKSAVVFEGMPLFSWSDNLGMIVPRTRADEIIELVRAAFASHEAGPFQLTVSQSPIRSEFKYLGVWYARGPNGAKAYVPHQVISAWEASIVSRLMLCEDDELGKVDAAIHSKLAQWRWTGQIEEVEAYLNLMLHSRRQSRERHQRPF